MDYLLRYLKKLHRFAGVRLYTNFLLMTAISMTEGLAIVLIFPVMNVIGVFQADQLSVPVLSELALRVSGWPSHWIIPGCLGAYILIILLQSLLQRNQAIRNTEIIQSFMHHMRKDIYGSLLQANWSFFLRKQKSDFFHILTSELQRAGQGVFTVMRLVTSLLFMLIQVALAFWLSARLTAFILVCGLLLSLYSRRFIHKSRQLGDEATGLSQDYASGITEHFYGIKDIKTNHLEQHHMNWFDDLSKRMEQVYIAFTKVQSTSQFLYKTASAVFIALFIYLALEIFGARIGELTLVSLIFTRLWPRLSGIQGSLEQISNTLPAFATLRRLERECSAYREQGITVRKPKQKQLALTQGIQGRRLFFRYDPSLPDYTLQDIDLFIPANKMTAIVGKTGAGKSTLVDLLIGLVTPEQGEILVDGVPLTGDHLPALRNSVSYVAQDPFLFHTSIRENLLLVEPEATEEELWQALHFSAAAAFVQQLPDGLDTVIGDRGIRLSGGERQRLVLARAILRKPTILVLDEATSALDNEHEAMIQSALEQLQGRMTIVVIAHRLSTIRHADQVIVLEGGKVIQQGTYAVLSHEKKGLFHRLLDYERLASTEG